MSKPTCAATGCDRPSRRYKLCDMHATRLMRTGTIDPRTITCEGCGEIVVVTTKGWASRKKFCTPECRKRTLNPIREACLGCGGAMPQDRRRKYCSEACRHLAYNHGSGGRPVSRSCTTCHRVVDLTERMADGTLRRPAYTLRCDYCQAKSRPTKYGMTATQVAERDGSTCRWCNDPVDLSLVGSRSKWAPSVDHIIPWSRGGTNNPENLQLMHRACNAMKGTRLTTDPRRRQAQAG